MITVIAPAFYNEAYHVRYLAKSAERYGIPVHWYGRSQPYKGWFNIQIEVLLDLIPTIDSSHFLYTDASDALFCSSLHEIEMKYERLHRPSILISNERSGVCAGGWLAEKSAILTALNVLKDIKPGGSDCKNPQVLWRVGLAHGYVKADVDDASDIFQVVDEPLQIRRGRVFNPRTNNYPSVVHFAGGYTDPVNGKAELIEPYWKELGYEK